MILSCAEMKAVEQRAFQDGVTGESLMEEAGRGVAEEVRKTFPRVGVCIAAFGKGNNGGDALVAARYLASSGWEMILVPAYPEKEWGELVRRNFEKLRDLKVGDSEAVLRATGDPLVVLDGLLGIGAKGGLREPLIGLTKAINQLRTRSAAHVFALDTPTGLDGDRGAADPEAVTADTTLTIGFAKAGLVADGAANFVGRIRVVPLEELTKRAPRKRTIPRISTAQNLASLLPRRRFDTHKGDYGRVGIVAGSPGMLGAAALCASSCVRAGAGLVTLYASADIAPQLMTRVPAEVMVRTVSSFLEVIHGQQDVFAIGPGLGRKHADDIQDLILQIAQPMVVDADGINILATQPELLNQCDGIRVVTPHPGEMARLAPDLVGKSRAEMARIFLERYPEAILLLKGGRTLVGQKGERLAYNSTGGPSMAKGGMGDVLTGVVAALIAQGLSGYDAARFGAWWCGRAAEIAMDSGGEAEETLTPTRMLDFLAPAVHEVRRGG